jgi:hypothetical protein
VLLSHNVVRVALLCSCCSRSDRASLYLYSSGAVAEGVRSVLPRSWEAVAFVLCPVRDFVLPDRVLIIWYDCLPRLAGEAGWP